MKLRRSVLCLFIGTVAACGGPATDGDGNALRWQRRQRLGWQPAVAKPALQAVAAACRPTLFSAQIPKFSWSPGELFCTTLSLLHDGPEPAGPLLVKAFLKCAGSMYFASLASDHAQGELQVG